MQNLSLTWYTEDPQFTRCFEKTALVWLPCLFLWILSPIEYYFLSHSKTRNVPWNWINITKLGITGALIVVLAAELTTIFQAVSNEQVVYDVDFYTPLIKALTIVSTKLNSLRSIYSGFKRPNSYFLLSWAFCSSRRRTSMAFLIPSFMIFRWRRHQTFVIL